MKYSEISEKKLPTRRWMPYLASSVLALAIAGCGGGGTGANSTANAVQVAPVSMAAAQWLTLKPLIDPATIGVTIPADGKPEVTFKVTDDKGNPVLGLDGQSKSSTALTPTNINIAFTLAKLIPGTKVLASLPGSVAADAYSPSKWVSYLITKVGTVAAPTTIGTYPTSDAQGTLKGNADGTYTYKFYRNIKDAANFVYGGNGLTALADIGTSKLASDLGTQTELTYDATATHRLGIIISGSQPGTGTATPTAVASAISAVPLANTFNIGYDFVPGTTGVGRPAVPGTDATRNIVDKASCTSCHDGKAIGHISTTSATNGIPPGSFVGRNDPRLCVTCHTDQTKYGFAEVNATNTFAYSTSTVYGRVNGQAAFTYPRMIHQFHMGNHLVKSGYNLNGHCTPSANGKIGTNTAACFNTVGFPQSPANCTKCHDASNNAITGTTATTDGDNWKKVPSTVACGSCHDGIDFSTGTGATLADAAKDRAADALSLANSLKTYVLPAVAPAYVPVPVGTTKSGHIGGTATDVQCSQCHRSDGVKPVDLYHRTKYATTMNPVAKDSISRITYELASVTTAATVPASTAVNPVIKFRILLNGTAQMTLPIPGYSGGPSLYVAWAVPQDGIATPADFNMTANSSIANILDFTKGSFAGQTALATSVTTADANGYFTVTLTGTAASPIKVPTLAASMVTGAIIGHFTQSAGTAGLDTTKYPSGVALKSTLKLATAATYTARRAIVSAAKCNTCHDQLGTDPDFHSGDRNDPTACNICHNGNRTSSGWAADSSTFIHGIHAASKRTNPYTWNSDYAFGTIGYPGILKDCNQCHLPNTVNFSAATSASAVPSMLWSGTATGKFVNVAGTLVTNLNVFSYKYVAPAVGVTPTSLANCIAQTATAQSATSVASLSPFINAGATTASAPDYGVGFTANMNTTDTLACTASGVLYTIPAGTNRQADATTLVNSPITSACFSCHDTTTAQNHMKSNGGSINATRAASIQAGVGEACLVCHGAGRPNDAAVIHK